MVVATIVIDCLSIAISAANIYWLRRLAKARAQLRDVNGQHVIQVAGRLSAKDARHIKDAFKREYERNKHVVRVL